MAVLCGARSIPTAVVERTRAHWNKMFTSTELGAARGRARAEERLAARLAAKRLAIELFSSIGFGGVTCLSVEIRNNSQGKPYFFFLDHNLGRFASSNLAGIFLTLSHTRGAGYAAIYARTPS